VDGERSERRYPRRNDEVHRRLAGLRRAMRAPVQSWLVALALAAALGAADEYFAGSAHARSLSAPWLVLAFVAGWTQRGPRRAAILSLACTYIALCGYGVMLLRPGGTHHLALGEALAYIGHEWAVFGASLVTAPLFGWFGWRWRTERAIAGALVTAAALCLEPMARRMAMRPIRFADVALAEIAAGLALATTVLIRQARSA
jgi:hypothetical protein